MEAIDIINGLINGTFTRDTAIKARHEYLKAEARKAFKFVFEQSMSKRDYRDEVLGGNPVRIISRLSYTGEPLDFLDKNFKNIEEIISILQDYAKELDEKEKETK